MPGELRTTLDFYQLNNERHQIIELCAIVRDWNNLRLKEGKLEYDIQAALCREYSEIERYLSKAAALFNSTVG